MGKAKPDPPRPPREYYELAMDRHRGADVAIEVSTAGLRKPVGEIYPARELLEMCVAAGKPVSLVVRRARARVRSATATTQRWSSCASAGVERVCVFEPRAPQVPLG